ncbi:hypothetical protein [Roseibium marinum]|uniref:Membrane protein YqaA with SNARE-associated domain n=1 Tax=Roseibium marinum TaxID=281252 RepID=A0A2S3UKK8_9HYPH|nr:hypothetical protein [Roseibium marinum]POF28215.1 membrane protein YqaA with SNARE-associated domain [Roseibium marinum]
MRPGSKTLAALWGFAEATLFFVVPDVLLTGLALRSLKRALCAALVAALAAAVGGALIWTCAHYAPHTSRSVLLQVPGISENTFATVQLYLESGLFQGMLRGAFSGVPYKIFAAEAGMNGTSLWVFALLSPLARLPRFVVVCMATWALSRLAGERLSMGAKVALSLALWVVFYVFYFAMAGW